MVETNENGNIGMPKRQKYVYNEDQLNQYFNKIQLKLTNKFEINLANLSTMMELHIQNIPYGNLSFHYFHKTDSLQTNLPTHPNDLKSTRGVSLDLTDIFNKLVVQGRDGYCFEQNLLFKTVLHSLKYKVYSVIARSVDRAHINFEDYKQLELMGARHTALVVELDNTKYLVDVGYVATSSFLPIPINQNPADDFDNNSEVVLKDQTVLQIVQTKVNNGQDDNSLYPNLYLVRGKQHKTIVSKQKVTTEDECFNVWCPLFVFGLDPFFLIDIQQINSNTVLHEDSIYYQHMLLKKVVLQCPFPIQNADGNGVEEDVENLGQGMLSMYDNQIKFTSFKLDKTKNLIVKKYFLQTKEDRFEAYKKLFGINLHEKDEEVLPETYQFMDRNGVNPYHL